MSFASSPLENFQPMGLAKQELLSTAGVYGGERPEIESANSAFDSGIIRSRVGIFLMGHGTLLVPVLRSIF
jgi:hypothetical protein